MDFINKRGKLFTAADAAALIRSLSKIPVDPQNFQGEERKVAVGLQQIQKRVEEAIVLYESRHQSRLTQAKRALLRESLTLKLLKNISPSGIESPVSEYIERNQKPFAELFKLSEKRRKPSKKRGL